MSNYADNILDKDGNPIYLEDKHLNDQTSQTAIATTDAVMLKDTNGEYHSIAKASFNEAVRAAMGSILTNFDKGTSIARIPGIDSSNDLGSVTAANLASVLGASTDAMKGYFMPFKQKVLSGEDCLFTSMGLILVDYNGGGGYGLYFNLFDSIATIVGGPSEVTITKPARGNNCVVSVTGGYANVVLLATSIIA